MKKKCLLNVTLSLLILQRLTGAIFYDMDTTKPLKCSFSDRHPNRIMMDKQSIEKVIHAEPESLQILIEDKAGQAFVMANQEITDPVTLCVMTSNGEVQDLEVTFQEQASQLVILQAKQPSDLAKQLPVEDCKMETIIQAVLANQIPRGSFVTSFCIEPSFLRKNMKIQEINRFDRQFEIIRVFTVSNCSKQKQIIQEKELLFENAAWVFLEKNTLIPKESLKAIVCIKKVF